MPKGISAVSLRIEPCGTWEFFVYRSQDGQKMKGKRYTEGKINSIRKEHVATIRTWQLHRPRS
jgi:hypothetical protein